jgi:hypothetical protein
MMGCVVGIRMKLETKQLCKREKKPKQYELEREDKGGKEEGQRIGEEEPRGRFCKLR